MVLGQFRRRFQILAQPVMKKHTSAYEGTDEKKVLLASGSQRRQGKAGRGRARAEPGGRPWHSAGGEGRTSPSGVAAEPSKGLLGLQGGFPAVAAPPVESLQKLSWPRTASKETSRWERCPAKEEQGPPRREQGRFQLSPHPHLLSRVLICRAPACFSPAEGGREAALLKDGRTTCSRLMLPSAIGRGACRPSFI